MGKISEIQRARFYKYKKHKIPKWFIHKKLDNLQKKIALRFIYKIPDTLRYAIFHGIFQITFLF